MIAPMVTFIEQWVKTKDKSKNNTNKEKKNDFSILSCQK